ncbi:MAG: prephenate dehydrogenase/arogenate dehydrogenase family protein [Candidatus Bathyarchaeota archaeon]
MEFNKKILIVGGTGKMGKWFAKFFKNKGFNVTIFGRSKEKTMKVAEELDVNFTSSLNTVRSFADVVMVSVPIKATPTIIEEVVNYVKRGTIIFDVASVKQEVLPMLKKAQKLGMHTLSLHPMFGPGANNLQGKNILVIPVTRRRDVLNFILKPFHEEGANIVFVKNAETHDRLMAYTLSLPHVLNILFARTLVSSNININRVKVFGGTTFNLQLTLAEAVLAEDPSLYASIQLNNKFSLAIVKMLAENIEKFKNILLKGDEKAFLKIFNKSKSYVLKDSKFKDAYKKVYEVLSFIG